jgi:hypothetical protein
MLDQMLVMVTKMVSDLEACYAAFRAAHPAVIADSDNNEHEHGGDDCGREVDIATNTANINPTFTGTGYNSDNSVRGDSVLTT